MSKDDNAHKLQLVHSKQLQVPEGAPCFVRVTERLSNGCVAFDFAIGTPDLFVELILPEAAFEQFCVTNNATHMTEEQSAVVEQEMLKWRYGEEGLELKRSAAEARADDNAQEPPSHS